MIVDLLIVGALVLLNGVLAMSELAVVSSRESRLRALERRKVAGAQAVLMLRAEPGRFLSTVQIGITLVGVVAGAFSGAALADPLADRLMHLGLGEDLADESAFVLVVAAVTYCSLIMGELVPKQIALRYPERVACWVAGPLQLLARFSRPVVWLLETSSRLVLKLLPPRGAGAGVTDEEIHAIVAEAASSGVVEPEERQIIAAVMRMADRTVRALMTVRQDIEWIDLDDPLEVQLRALRDCRHSKMVAARGDVDQFVGWVSVKRLFDAMVEGCDRIVPSLHVEEALVVPASLDALDLIHKLRKAPLRSALVVDEFGSLQGIVTVGDILSAIVGHLLDEPDEQTEAVRRPDGSWLVDGDLGVGLLSETLGMTLPEDPDYETVAGMVLSLLGHLPRVGESLVLADWVIEVVDLDGRRIDKLLIRPQRSAPLADN